MDDKEILYIDVSKLPEGVDVPTFMKCWRFLTDEMKCMIIHDKQFKFEVGNIKYKSSR